MEKTSFPKSVSGHKPPIIVLSVRSLDEEIVAALTGRSRRLCDQTVQSERVLIARINANLRKRPMCKKPEI